MMMSAVLQMEELHCGRKTCGETAEENRRRKQRRRSMTVRRRLFLIIALAAAAVFLSLYIGMTSSDAHDLSSVGGTQIRSRYYQQIEIKSGDSLWNIADEHMTDEYDSINDYVDDIMSVNKLTSDRIHAGEYLIIPYYR